MSQVTAPLSLVTFPCFVTVTHGISLRGFWSQTDLSRTKMVTKQVEKQW